MCWLHFSGSRCFNAVRAASARSVSWSDPRKSSVTMSLGPMTLKAATGSPQARASTITMPKVSVREGKTKISAER